ncbi:MAG: LPXTG cell wall anchor domain-containing protein [Ruminococcus sp.]|nr:LPXTG cell wall anchor domain-containing protein [Ruminococcus sp.]
MNPGDDKSIRAEAGNPKLKSAVFYPYNYYYIREKTSDTYQLLNGDDNGFVKLQDENYYLNLQSNENEPCILNVTAKNTPDMNLDINVSKEWYSAETNGVKVTPARTAKFEIYKGYTQGNPVKNGDNYIVNSEVLQKISERTTSDEPVVKNLPAYEKDTDGNYKKVYYYVREADGNHKLINENAENGFISDGAGKYGSFYDESDISETEKARTYTFKNVPQLKLQVKKEWAEENTSVNEIKVHLYRSITLADANREWDGMKMNAPVAQTSLDDADTVNSATRSLGIFRAGTLNQILENIESDKNDISIAQVISDEQIPVVYNELDDSVNIDQFFVKTLTINTAGSWIYTDTLPVYDENGNMYYYWVVEDTESAASYNVGYTFPDADNNTTNCINPETIGNGTGEGIITVINSLEVIVILPETGGSGTRVYTVTGGAIVLLSAAVFIIRRRKKKI